MRFNQQQIAIIKSTVHRHFGRDVKVYVFGSRRNNALKGGDIDLLLEDIPAVRNTVNSKVSLLVDLKKQIGDQKIDIVLRSAEQESKPFLRFIDKSKTRLC